MSVCLFFCPCRMCPCREKKDFLVVKKNDFQEEHQNEVCITLRTSSENHIDFKDSNIFMTPLHP